MDGNKEGIYKLTVDLNVLEHLGINLYSNVPAVLTEIVANAWDADAERVEITIEENLKHIEVLDDGIGMDLEAINKKFLWVGYQKRTERDLSLIKQRPVMGRKGVGKLAPFSIANVVEVYSHIDGENNAFRMRVDDIREAAKLKRDYYPEEIEHTLCPDKNGTRLVLKELHRDRMRSPNLIQRLARRFSVIGKDDFSIIIKNKDGSEHEVTLKDRGDLEKLQYIWTIGDWTPPEWLDDYVLRKGAFPGRLDAWDNDMKIHGWIGTSNKPKDLDSASGNINVIVLLARGRLFQENVLNEVSDGRHYTKYLVGQLDIDFLDVTAERDIATSDRQRVQEGDPRYSQVVSFVKSTLAKIEAEWSKWRPEDRIEEVQHINPVVKEWLESLSPGHQKHAQKLIGSISSLDAEDDENVVLKHAILGFERAKLTGSTKELSEAVTVDAKALLPLLAGLDSIEASLYRDIVSNRLNVIKAFQSKISNNELEKVLQDYLFEHLWLLDPSWERATGSEIIEKPVNEEFSKITANLTEKERRGRVDIKYRKANGRHVIIELKRADRVCGVMELVQQGHKYRDALLKCLNDRGRSDEPYEVVFVLGKPLKEEGAIQSQTFIDFQLTSINGRCVKYNELVDSALNGYAEYIAARGKVDKIQKVIDSLTSKAK
ncbi:BbrUII/HgiDII family restriction enzyme [Pseudomonas protegens]|uniref:BbrUII/HgiDII family restriction enzyme n=1 Tax=Pseudomonas protegens TaxID=380021 RepID=UPI000CD2BB30|nr:ATP-binding protein [Pseudomonas protegens]POA91174.1 ATP-binding protein [Pseudomonas protegens]